MWDIDVYTWHRNSRSREQEEGNLEGGEVWEKKEEREVSRSKREYMFLNEG